MKYSFVVIAYNEADKISATLGSIYAQEGLKDFELIVVDDGSTDGMSKVIQREYGRDKKLRIIALEHNKGRGAARSTGVKAARGDYVCFIDADILLPKNWLVTCARQLEKFDACGGVAVPDGDVAYIYRKFSLKPKVVTHTTTITGSNGMFKKHVFSKVSFDIRRKNGEDTDLGHQLTKANLKTTTIRNLHVEHNETKGFIESIVWLYQNGVGASKQLIEFKRLRLPDLVFFAFAFTTILAILIAAIMRTYVSLEFIPFYLAISALMHLRSKFFYYPRKSLAYGGAMAANMLLLLGYFCGRFLGLTYGMLGRLR